MATANTCCPSRHQWAATRVPSSATMAAMPSPIKVVVREESPSRKNTPSRDWLPVYSGEAVRVSPPDRPPKKATVSSNSRMAPSPVKARKLTMPVSAARRRPIRKTKTTNSAGVSLIAAASPISVPWGIRRRSPG